MKNKALVLDILVLVIIVGLLTLAVFSLKTPKEPVGKTVVLTLNVTRNQDIIYPEASKLGPVFFNNSEHSVLVTEVKKTTRKNTPALEIKLEGIGEVTDNKIIFNGQRVLISQKAELHAKYFAQGVIQNVEYKK